MYNNIISLAIANDINIIVHSSLYFLYFLKNKKRKQKYITFDISKKYKKYEEGYPIVFLSLIITNDILLLYIIIFVLIDILNL